MSVEIGVEIYEKIAAASEQLPKVRVVTDVLDRSCGRQGDVDLRRFVPNMKYDWNGEVVSIPDGLGKIIAENEDIQVAVGNTVGSRHILVASKGVRVYAPTVVHELVGPTIVVDDGFEALLKHPEHASWKLTSGKYQITYPRDYQQNTVSRQSD